MKPADDPSSFCAELAAGDVVGLHFRRCAGRQNQVYRQLAPLNASAEEQKTFDDGHASMTQGWGGTLEQLATYLKGAA